jgi:hypothetical protein
LNVESRLLLLQFLDGCANPGDGLAADTRALVEYAIDRRGAETGLKGDVLDQKGMATAAALLMDF